MPHNQCSEFLNVTAAAARAGVSRQWFSELVAQGSAIPGMVNHGGFRLFERAAFEPWAASVKARQKRGKRLTKS